MKGILLLLLFCQVVSPVKHSLELFLTGSSGLKTIPEFVAVLMVDEVQAGCYDSNSKRAQPKQDWMKKIIEDDPGLLKIYNSACMTLQVTVANLVGLSQYFNRAGGVHVLQGIAGCEWDNETKEITSVSQIGYDGEDFSVFDLKTRTWNASKPQAVIIEPKLESYNIGSDRIKDFLTNICPKGLNMSLDYGKSSLMRTDLPSVFLLQKTPSSPVSCFATGFYPHRAEMFWRKDGEELHEDVDRGEILPNNDGSFQMSVDLKLSSVTPEDWKKYECVFQLSGVKDDIITKLDKAVIRTNWETHMTTLIILMVALAVIITTAAGIMIRKKKKAPDNVIELSDQLNPEA